MKVLLEAEDGGANLIMVIRMFPIIIETRRGEWYMSS